MKTIDIHVCWAVIACSMFVVGVMVGNEKAAVALQPCPQAGKAELIKATVTGQVCQYAEIVKGGRKIKWSVKAL